MAGSSNSRVLLPGSLLGRVKALPVQTRLRLHSAPRTPWCGQYTGYRSEAAVDPESDTEIRGIRRRCVGPGPFDIRAGGLFEGVAVLLGKRDDASANQFHDSSRENWSSRQFKATIVFAKNFFEALDRFGDTKVEALNFSATFRYDAVELFLCLHTLPPRRYRERAPNQRLP
jgi:hypothetical protein